MNNEYILQKLLILDSNSYYVGELFFMPDSELKLNKDSAIEFIQKKQYNALIDIIGIAEIKKRFDTEITYSILKDLFDNEFIDVDSIEFAPEMEDIMEFFDKYQNYKITITITAYTKDSKLEHLYISHFRVDGMPGFDLIQSSLLFRHCENYHISKNGIEVCF